ncbi:MAG: hypothetical protein NZM38_09885 [Cytophagales bacterium]|nr:hypothetical protein [Cytophagales bacterium]MDW8385066.1 hypothetical protein [Flammeovirgaceae bacterium]
MRCILSDKDNLHKYSVWQVGKQSMHIKVHYRIMAVHPRDIEAANVYRNFRVYNSALLL